MFFLYFLFLTSINAEKFQLATDDIHQAEIYGPLTIVQSWLTEDSELYAFFMNSFIGVQSKEFLVASNISKPYTIFQVDNILHLISTNHDGYGKLSFGNTTKQLNFKTGKRIKFDYIAKKIHVLLNGMLVARHYDTFFFAGLENVGNATDFYVQNDKVTICPDEQCRDFELINSEILSFDKESYSNIFNTSFNLFVISWIILDCFLIFYIIVPILKNERQILRQ